MREITQENIKWSIVLAVIPNIALTECSTTLTFFFNNKLTPSTAFSLTITYDYSLVDTYFLVMSRKDQISYLVSLIYFSLKVSKASGTFYDAAASIFK